MYDLSLSFTEQAKAYAAAVSALGVDDRSDDSRSRAVAAYLKLVLVSGGDPAEPFAILSARDHIVEDIFAAGATPEKFRVRLSDVETLIEDQPYSEYAIEALELLGADSECADPRWWTTGPTAPTVALS